MCLEDLWRFCSQAEDFSNAVIRRSRRSLPTVARLCLTATFLEDAIRIWLFWDQHHAYFQNHLNCWSSLVTLIMYVSLAAQLVGCALVLLRCCISLAVALLAGVVMLQLQIYAAPWQLELLLHDLSLLGGLLLLYVEAHQPAQQVYCTGGGLPIIVSSQRQQYMQLMGRIMLVVMYLTLLQFQWQLCSVLLSALGLLLMLMVVIGYRTRLAALALATSLTLWNAYRNCWWFADGVQRQMLKFTYFNTLSVIGGILMIVALGPGDVSLEQYKKRW